MNFKKVFINELSPAKYNPRKDLQPSDPEYQRIKRSIEEFGYVDPIIVNADYTVIGGHQRLKVMKELGHAQIDVVVVDIPKDKEKALNVALNKISGEWDTQRLTDLLGELKAEGMDISITGFDDKELDGLLRELHKDDEPQDTEPQISRAEELRKEWGTELGQMWQCGEHRVICGDCTDPEVVQRVMGGEKADMVFTDPPYNINYTYNEYEDNKTESDYLELVEKFIKTFLNITAVDCPVYVMSANNRQDDFRRLFEDNGIHFHQWIYWVKTNPGYLGRSDYIQNYETATYGYLGKHRFYGKMQLAAETIARDTGKDKVAHPAQRPLSFLTKIVNNSTNENEIVWDSFLGSGTTLIACENLKRRCRGCEIDPGYVAVILQRYKDTFPGKEIKLIE